MIKEKQHRKERPLADFVPNDLLDAKIQESLPVLLKEIFLVAEVRVEGRASDVRAVNQVLES
jgi:hypothetical protein